MVWKAGESGNIAGVSNRHRALKARLDGMTMKAAAVLEDVMANGTNGERLSAAKEVLDRSLGRAKQQATVQVQHSSDAHLQALIAMAAATQARLEAPQTIDITPVYTDAEHPRGEE
jgi:hypothetical protein